MLYLNSFLFCGIVCLIGQLILDNTKLTPGHITTIFVVLGCFLDVFKRGGFNQWRNIGFPCLKRYLEKWL